MRLKRLKVRGFKSFADKTEFDFDADLTGIVGPNGCGKSNVVDALKWVLGDQRARSLRGAEMTDVIFKGAEGREGLPFAEVSVVLEDDEFGDDGGDGAAGDGAGGNGDGNGDGRQSVFAGRSEISIGRRLTRDKESNYLINGEVVRLKDVRDLLMDTGLGVGAYSVMEQGRIDAVLSANPEDRRAIFEEAAGISRYKVQKRETLRRLERTEQNLARVQDLLEERARRIRSLKIQAGKARRYREIQSRLTDLKSALAVVDARAVRADEAERHRVRAELEERVRQADAELRGRAEEIERLERSIIAREDAVRQALDQVRGAESRREAALQRATSLDHRADELDEDAASCTERVGRMTDQERERRAALESSRQRLVGFEDRLVALGRELEQRRAAARAAQERVKQLQVEREEARDRVLECIHDRTRARNKIHDSEAQLRGLATREARLSERLRVVDAERRERGQDLEEWQRVLSDVRARAADLERQEHAVLGELEGADREASDLARSESGLRERLASTRSRLEVLQAMEAHLEGLDSGPRHLLEQAPPGLLGRLTDRVDVDLDHSRALEAALGPFVQALVVDTRANAEAMLAGLAGAQQGRAILLVASEFRTSIPEPPADSLPPGAEFLVHRVRCDDAARPMVTWLLRGVCVVGSIADADPGRSDLCYVTLDGSLLCGPRFEGGDGGESRSGLVVRKAQIHALVDDEQALQTQRLGLQADMDAVASLLTDLKERVRELAIARQGVREREHDALTEQSRTTARLQDLQRERDTIELECGEVHRARIGTLVELGRNLVDELCVRRREDREGARETATAEQLEQARHTADDALRGEQDVRVQQAGCASDREALKNEIGLVEQALQDLAHAGAELEQRRTAALEGVDAARRDAERQRRAAEAVAEELDVLHAARSAASAELARERERKSTVQDEVRELERARGELGEELSQCRIAIAECEHRFQRLEERLREETSIELRRCLGEIDGLGIEVLELPGPIPPDGAVERLLGPALPPDRLAPERQLARRWDDSRFDLEAARREAQVLQSQVERLGNVNLGAVTELEEEESRFGELERDVEDLTESRKALMEALRRMEEESRALFEKTFELARENFRGIFRKLFQGGRADMYLTASEDSLEAGIEIVAKPPGKELQSIALLSGGERSLTALAILFAVFEVKPSPFCILDEVDAALDETNVERFLRVLDRFVGPSQFCIVTHHKRTMAHCQVLYGITMERRGVSSRIAVSLEDVDELHPGNGSGDAGGARNASGAADEPSTANSVDDRATQQRIAGEESIGF